MWSPSLVRIKGEDNMKAFMDKDFLLDTDTAKMLYHDYDLKINFLYCTKWII